MKREKGLGFWMVGGIGSLIKQSCSIERSRGGWLLSMPFLQCCSSCSDTWGKQNSHLSHVGGSRSVEIILICNYGDMAVIKIAKTSKNVGKQFWECHHYKV